MFRKKMFPLDTIVARAKRRGFVYPGSDIYGGLANAWDYGPYGIQLKKNIQDLRWKNFVEQRQDMIGLDAQILMHPRVWEASGHVAGFNDPLIDDKNTGERFRADKLIEERISKLKGIFAEITQKRKVIQLEDAEQIKASVDYYKGSGLDPETLSEMMTTMFETVGAVESDVEVEKLLLSYLNDKYGVSNLIPESWTFDQMKVFIAAEIPNNPNKKKEKAERTDVRKFELMFYTYQGVIHNDENKIWMRPETAQGIFVNFKNVLDTTRMRIPFGIGQVGKAFRNEITPGNFLYRTREFEQMEIEYFVENDKAKGLEALEMWKQASMSFRRDAMQIKEENLKFRAHEADELSHYSAGTFDVEYNYPWGWGELQGIAYRTDFDLKAHMEHSKQDLQYTDPYTGVRYVPHVIEPSFGLSRTVLAVMFDCYDEEEYTAGNGEKETRVVTRFPKALAPVKFAILPLIKKDEKQVAFAEDLFRQLSKQYNCEYDDGGAIGKRYRRQDEIGTPYCITIDHQTIEDGTVTIRERDTMEQTRKKPEEIGL